MTATIQVFPDRATLSAAAAVRFAAAVTEAAAARGRALVVLAGGGTPLGLYRLLAEPPYRDTLPWDVVTFFWGDDRIVPPDDPESNFGAAQAALLGPVGIDAKQIVRIRGELAPAEAALDYAAALRAFTAAGEVGPRFDLVLLGLGGDGHTASLFPGAPPPLPDGATTLAVSADYDGRPAARVTLTPRAFNLARQVLFLVSGAEKAAAVAQTLSGPPDPTASPAQMIAPPQGEVVWLLDADAAAGLAGAAAPGKPQ
jgi:6-phosphogluconolactonase